MDGNDTINGGAGNDNLFGGSGNDTLRGGSGNDVLNGGTGIDNLDGGDGNDTYIVDNVLDVAAEQFGDTLGGIDTVQASVSYTLSTNLENLTLTGVGAINGTGNAKNNVINGNSGNNVLSGLDGNDTINGGAGNDTLIGGAGNDTLIGGAGNDTLIGGAGNDILNGTNFSLAGNGERDFLRSDSLLDTDIFILGDRSDIPGTVYYSNQGNADYAVIIDFDRFDISDRIQLLGSAASYSLSNVTVDSISGTGIRYFSDLIGIVQGVDASSLSLTNTNQFIYV